MRELTYHTLDVFTAEPFGGNQLAVVPDAPDLDAALMQSIAREFNYPETAFVQVAEHPDALYRLRIFTPVSELPFAGHPTIGTAQLLYELGKTPAPVDGLTAFQLEEGIGLIPINVKVDEHGHCFSQLTATRLPQVSDAVPSGHDLADMLGLDADQIVEQDDYRPAHCSAGVPFTCIPVRDRTALARCSLDITRWREVLATTEAPQVYVYCRAAFDEDVDFHARMFAPALGVPEDPATGAAATALAGLLFDISGEGGSWVIAQGEDMARPGRIYVEIDGTDGVMQSVRVGGRAVRICTGHMRF